jgi:hypothetical protein
VAVSPHGATRIGERIDHHPRPTQPVPVSEGAAAAS